MFARTERLLLRPAWSEDAPALARAIGDEAIVRNLASAPWPYRQADAEAFVATERRPDECALLIFRRTRRAPQLVGAAGLGRSPGGAIELGYWISRPHWGLGYATEAADAVVTLARDALRLRHIEAHHFVDNPASGRVLEKLGFQFTGIVAPRFSAGRKGIAPAKLFTKALQPGAEEDVIQPANRMLAA